MVHLSFRRALIALCTQRFLIGCGLVVVLLQASAVAYATTLPLASTVAVDAATPTGAVVVYRESSDTYVVSTSVDSPEVFGIVAAQPAIVLQTSSTSPSVVTQGVTPLLVDTSGGVIARGDVLTTGPTAGVAQKASTSAANAFAIALEPFTDTSAGLIQVEFNPTKAQAVAIRLSKESPADDATSTWVRVAIAIAVILIGVGFLLWSLRSMFVSGITSIGRNPRAKQAVMITTLGGVVLGAVLLATIVFVALGILVLPIT